MSKPYQPKVVDLKNSEIRRAAIAQLEAEAMLVACSFFECGAAPGEICRSFDGQPHETHCTRYPERPSPYEATPALAPIDSSTRTVGF